jgi:hypothetical protein
MSGNIKIDAAGFPKKDQLELKNIFLVKVIYENGKRQVVRIPLSSHPILKVLNYYSEGKGENGFDPKAFWALASYGNLDYKSATPSSQIFVKPPGYLALFQKRQAQKIGQLLKSSSLSEEDFRTIIGVVEDFLKYLPTKQKFETTIRDPKMVAHLCELIGIQNKNKCLGIIKTAISIARLFYDKRSGKADYLGFVSLIDKLEEAAGKYSKSQGYNVSLSFARQSLTGMLTYWYAENYHEDWVEKN